MSTEQDRLALGRALFSPQTVALVGASADAAKLASRPQRVLRKHGFTGTIIPINPGRTEINGDRAYPDIRSVPQKVDHAFIMVPAKAVPGVIEDCAAAGVKAATIFSAGFAETGEEGARIQKRMVETARAGGVRLIGPNCLGIANVTGKTVLSANAVLESQALLPGALSLVSQSGSMMGGTVSRAQERGLGFSKMVSVGNECDVGVGEIVDCLVDDPDTQCILLFLEAFRDAPRLGAAARRAFDLGKPVIAFKLGRSAVGREIATTHTGAIAGADDVAEAFFRDHGIIRVKTYEALFEAPQLVMGFKPPKGKRVAVFTGTGGAAAMVVDQLGLAGVEVVPPPQPVIDELAAKGIQISDAPLTDLPMGKADGPVYPTIIQAFYRSDHCDAVIAVQGSTAALRPDSVRERTLDAGRGPKPLANFLGPAANEALGILQRGGAAAFRTPEACADAVRAYCEWRAPLAHPAVDSAVKAKLHAALQVLSGQAVNERTASQLLGTLGISFAAAQVVQGGGESVGTGFPVVAKILSADIPHKTEAGGVALNIADSAQLKTEVDAMLARIRKALPQAKLDGVLVQRMETGIAEVIVGFRRDRDAGPLVMVGVGGILAELGGGHAVRLAPVTLETARDMIDEVKSFAVLRGYRNKPKGDLEALARVVQAMSQLACADAVEEAEINPLLVKSDGVVAVDALVNLNKSGG
jgi:acyl-CoA synthetase (NDP forming)